MIETLDDILEQVANWCGVYGAHRDRAGDCNSSEHCCRSCWVSFLKARIERAVEIEAKLNK